MNYSTIMANKGNCRMYASQTRYHLQQAMQEVDTCITEAGHLKGVDAHKTTAKLQDIKSELQGRLNSLDAIR